MRNSDKFASNGRTIFLGLVYFHYVDSHTWHGMRASQKRDSTPLLMAKSVSSLKIDSIPEKYFQFTISLPNYVKQTFNIFVYVEKLRTKS